MSSESFKGVRTSLSEYSTPKAYFIIFTHWKTCRATFSYIFTVLKDFFSIQFARKFNFTETPIVHVDNELDDKVPFNPAKVKIYLGFVDFWIKPLTMLTEVLGVKKAIPYIVEFLGYIKAAYYEAGQLYRISMTTTNRPKYYKGRFRLIHVFDPHFLCVPSLHIGVVTLTYAFYRKIFPELPVSQEQKDLWLDQLYRGAASISETVLYIKQHSVNCIPAAMHMMSFIMKPHFTPEDSIKFLNDLFKDAPDVTPEDQKALSEYMKFVYERFLLEGSNEDDWKIPVKRWLREYAEQNGQKNIAQHIL